MILNTLKTIGGIAAGFAAGKVTTDILKEFTTRSVGVQIVIDGNVVSSGTGACIRQGNLVEKAVLAVGITVISGVVATAVGTAVHKELGDIEELLRSVHEDAESVLL